MPSGSEPVFVEPAPEAQQDSSKKWHCKKAFQGLKISPQAWCIHSTQKINDMSYNQCTGPEEHLMSDFEHMKTSLYLTDVVVLRHEGDTVNFLGLEITKTSKGFEVENSTDLVESLLNFLVLENSQPTASPGRRSTMMELASATPLDGHEYSNFRTAVGKLIFMAPWRPDMQFAIQQLSTQVLNYTAESKRAVKQLIRYLKGTQHTCLRLKPREMVQKGLLEIASRGDSDWAGDSATRQCVTGFHCNVQNVTMCIRSLKQTAISLSSCEAEFYAASACTGELLGLAELFKELHYDVAARLEMDSDSARHILQRKRPGGLKHIEIRCLAIQQWVREKRLSVSRVDTKNNTADLFTKHLDGLRTQSLAKKLGLRILDGTDGTNRTNGTNDNG